MLLEVIKTQFILELENNNYTAQKMSNKWTNYFWN